MEATIGRTRITLVRGDITAQSVDAIVNAANSTLLGGAGVDGAIHRRGGPSILEECRALRRTRYPDGLPTGEAVVTGAGDLPAHWVVHTVGPVWHDGSHGEEALLASAYSRSLAEAAATGARSIAFPAISTGAYGYPIEQATRTAVAAVVEFLRGNPDAFDEVRFVTFSAADEQVYAGVLVGAQRRGDAGNGSAV